jgi:ligand-binding sensor domain-containing protein
MKILGIAVDPITPTIIYAATEAGIFKSTTSGSSWSNSYASGVFSGRVNAIGTSPARLYIGSSTGLWRAGALEP